jgi:hypothetical protein
VTVRIVSDQYDMERFVGHKLNDADATFQMMRDQGKDVTSLLTEGKQWQAVTLQAGSPMGIPSVLQQR